MTKVYKVLEDYFCVHSKESLYLVKDDIIFIEKCTIPYIGEYWETQNYKEVNILTKLIRENNSKTINIVEPKLTKYGIRSSYISYNNFENISKEGIRELINSKLNMYYECEPIEDITLQYLRSEKLEKLG